ncbi:hypothetical protein EBAPG3_15045 [Nitrosospira lacus]|uniref:Uncharacterized protein n=1 Tax=Nitrosospira lacus TaxID=1288494 RepID=A0A1W6SQK2_9PROT|nr:hypothetical protein EBAPG3_15045 [Nitrosospira lacus]
MPRAGSPFPVVVGFFILFPDASQETLWPAVRSDNTLQITEHLLLDKYSYFLYSIINIIN